MNLKSGEPETRIPNRGSRSGYCTLQPSTLDDSLLLATLKILLKSREILYSKALLLAVRQRPVRQILDRR